MHHGPLIAILVAGLGLAFVFGALAQKLRISPLVGYLVAGVAVGPQTWPAPRTERSASTFCSPAATAAVSFWSSAYSAAFDLEKHGQRV